MFRLARDLIRPYRGRLIIVLLAMLFEAAMSLATIWPLKIILDNAIGNHKLSPCLHRLLGPLLESGHKLHLAALAALALC